MINDCKLQVIWGVALWSILNAIKVSFNWLFNVVVFVEFFFLFHLDQPDIWCFFKYIKIHLESEAKRTPTEGIKKYPFPVSLNLAFMGNFDLSKEA